MAQSKIEEWGNEELMFHFLLMRDSLITMRKALDGSPNIESVRRQYNVTLSRYKTLLNEIYRRMDK